MPFPRQRLRRLRRGQLLRDAVADVRLHPDQLIYPLFVAHLDQPRDVPAMPGVQQLPVSHALQRMREMTRQGLRQFILFGVTPPERKTPAGDYACSHEAPVNRLLAEAKNAGLDALLYADLCFCEYTDHGHCGLLRPDPDDPATVDNDATLDILAQAALAQAQAGADIIAPSGMMDGQVQAIRTALDQHGHADTPILSYAMKYASSFYDPFRQAGEGGMAFGDRKGYQMDPRRAREWRSEMLADLHEGADMLMVKPALPCLDILRQARDACDAPLAAYQVSGEYAMLHAAAEAGTLQLQPAALETLTAIRRAGADLILTYFAPDLLDWLG